MAALSVRTKSINELKKRYEKANPGEKVKITNIICNISQCDWLLNQESLASDGISSFVQKLN